MAVCEFQGGIDFDCADIIAGGLKTTIWVGNLAQLSATNPFDVDVDGYVTDLNGVGTVTKFLYPFVSTKESYSAGWESSRTEGGNPSYTHTVTLRNYVTNPIDRQVVEALSKSDVFAIVQTSSNTFEIYGIELGLNLTAGTQNSGTNTQADTRATLTLTGLQTTLPKLFFDTDIPTTLSKILSYTF
jgi:hypothetical protein